MKAKAFHTQFDLVIIGGAMTGASLALALNKLTQAKLSIALIEAKAINHEHQGFDARSIALSYGSLALLDSFELGSALSAVSTPIKHIHVSDKGHAGMTAFHARTEQQPFLGQVIELSDAGQIFYQKLEQAANISLFCPVEVQAIERFNDYCSLKLSDGSDISTKLVVAADGGLSSSCDMLGIARAEHHFNQTAIIANILSEKPHDFHAFERFTPDGPVALLPMSKGRSSLVWCTLASKAQALMALDKDAFLTRLQQHFGWRLGKFTQSSLPYSYPLILRQSTKLISHRFAVVGNAAQTLHPIAGQGYNLGLRDVASLAFELARAFEQKKDIGAMHVLQAYRAKREADRDSTIRLISSLVYGFSNQSLPIIAARNLGLMAMSSPLVKAPLLRQMMGLNRMNQLQ